MTKDLILISLDSSAYGLSGTVSFAEAASRSAVDLFQTIEANITL